MRKYWVLMLALLSGLAYGTTGTYFSTGEEFSAGETVTPQKLEDTVEKAELKTGFGIVATQASSPTNESFLHRDSNDSYRLKYHDNTSWATLMIAGSEDSANFEDAFEYKMQGGDCYRSPTYDSKIYCIPGTIMINGKLRRNTAVTNVSEIAGLDDTDWMDVYAVGDATDATTWTLEAVDSGAVPAGSTPNATNYRLIASFYHDATYDLTKYILYKEDGILVFDYMLGDDTNTITISTLWGELLDGYATIVASSLGAETTLPNVPHAFTADVDYPIAAHVRHSNNRERFEVQLVLESGQTFSSSVWYGITAFIHGKYTL